MTFELILLGTSAAVPYQNRWLAGQVLNIQNQHFLIDCGEGTQFRMKEYGISKGKINHIFISHLHGDHCFGLFGVLTSMAMEGREAPLTIFSPAGLEEMIRVVFEKTYYKSPFPIHFITVNTEGVSDLLDNTVLSVKSFPLQHRVPCVGYVFREKPFPLNIRPEKIDIYKIPFTAIKEIKQGADFMNSEGVIIPNHELTLPPLQPRAYAYCSDTAYLESVIDSIKQVDLLYHEATFAHDMADHAAMTGHSTTIQAATIAQKAEVKKLIIGHFSSRYPDLAILLKEAKTVFEATVLGIDGEKYEVGLQRSAYSDSIT